MAFPEPFTLNLEPQIWRFRKSLVTVPPSSYQTLLIEAKMWGDHVENPIWWLSIRNMIHLSKGIIHIYVTKNSRVYLCTYIYI